MDSTSLRRTTGAVVIAGGLLLFGALSAPAKDEGPSLPPALLEFAKATRVGGTFVVEVDPAGRMVGIEAEVTVESLPKAVVDFAAKAFPGAKPTGGEKEWILGRNYWEIVLDASGTRIELLVAEDGTEGGREEVIPTAAVPKAILDAANAAVPGGTVEVVEKVTGAEAGGRGTEYHVKKRIDGELQRISVSPEGKVALVLRKIQAELKLPR